MGDDLGTSETHIANGTKNDGEEENEQVAESELPPLGKVRSIIEQIETFYDSKSNDPTVRNGNVLMGVPVLSIGGSIEDGTEDRSSLRTPSPDSAPYGVFGRLPWIGSLSRKKSRENKPKRNSSFYSHTDESVASDIADSECLSPASCTEERDDCRPDSIYSADYAPLDSDAESLQNVDASIVCGDSVARQAFLVAQELVTSENDFICSLRLMNVVFRNFVEQQNHASNMKIIPPEDLRKLLNHLPELQALNEDLFQDLKDRLLNWENNPKISDVIVKKGAFLKIYATYIESFEVRTQFLDDCCTRYVKFCKALKDFESGDQCRKLTLKHFMLKPVQRIPQYRLLLNDYLKNLSEESPDYQDTLQALSIVTEVAEHVNNRMKHGDKVGRMVQLQSMLSDFTLIKAGRELVKDGPLEKLCRKTVKDRYFILLNDCLIYSTPSKTFLNFHQTLPLGGMKVAYNEDDCNLYTFKVFSTTKSFILCAKSESERKEWVDALQTTINDYVARQMTFTNRSIPTQPLNFQLGKEAPLWIQDSKVTMCQICTAEFTHLFRRHHCRACGKVICWKCGDNQAPLQYKQFKARRVCDGCFDKLLNECEENEETIKENLGVKGDEELVQNAYMNLKSKFVRSSYMEKEKKHVPNRLKEVAAKDAGADVSGWLRRWKSHKWKTEKHWYVLKERVLYVYRASEDVIATKSISVLGYKIERGGANMWDNVKPELVFQLTHQQQAPMVYAADCQMTADRWFHCLTAASQMT